MLQWLAEFFGLTDGGGMHYLWWSGIGSDLGELAIFGTAIGLYRRHACHVKGCPRIGKHAVAGSPYTVCARHHPDVPDVVTHEHIRAASGKGD